MCSTAFYGGSEEVIKYSEVHGREKKTDECYVTGQPEKILYWKPEREHVAASRSEHQQTLFIEFKPPPLPPLYTGTLWESYIPF